jgi:hypothetical protein
LLLSISESATFKVLCGQLQRHPEKFNGLFSLPRAQEQSNRA